MQEPVSPARRPGVDIHAEIRRSFPPHAQSVLDVGCGSTGKARMLTDAPVLFGIDVDERGVELTRRRGLYAMRWDMRRMHEVFAARSFDVVLFKDSLEHILKDEALRLLAVAQEIARMAGGESVTDATRRHAAELLGMRAPAGTL